MNILTRGKITLAGAGPGDPELITLKGLKAIKNADVILFDSLVNESLLDYNADAIKIFVGKRKGVKSVTQSSIHHLMIDYAEQNKNVLRLKGGDPMIFGRAWEEIETARNHGIPLEIIPGISAYSGMASANQVPVTRRCVNESVWICTGATCRDTLSEDIALAAQSTATVVIYMGMSRIHEIIALFKQYKPGTFPVCVVQNATTPLEKIASGNLDDILKKTEKEGISNPALIVLGQAAEEVQSGLYSDHYSQILSFAYEQQLVK